MNINTQIDLLASFRDVRTHTFKAGALYLSEGESVAIEIIPSAEDDKECRLHVKVIPYGPPSNVSAEGLAGTKDAIEFVRQSSHPRLRAAAEVAAANLSALPVGELADIEVELWVEDKSQEWDERGKQRLDSAGESCFDGVTRDAVCWIEFLHMNANEATQATDLTLLPAQPRNQLEAAHFRTPGPRRLRTLKRLSIAPPLDDLAIRFEVGQRIGEEKERLWIAIHTMRREWRGATVQFQFGPVRGALQLLPAGEGWQGTTELKVSPDKFEKLAKFHPRITVQPIQQ